MTAFRHLRGWEALLLVLLALILAANISASPFYLGVENLVNLLDLSLLRVPGLSEFWRDAVLGVLILTAVTVDYLLGQRIGRIATRARGRPAAGVPDA